MTSDNPERDELSEEAPWCDHPQCVDHAHLDGWHTGEDGAPFRRPAPNPDAFRELLSNVFAAYMIPANGLVPIGDHERTRRVADAWAEVCMTRLVEAGLVCARPAVDDDTVERRYRELLADIWLYVNWRYVTRELTTEQKELWADAVEATGDPDEGTHPDRWWRGDAAVRAMSGEGQ